MFFAVLRFFVQKFDIINYSKFFGITQFFGFKMQHYKPLRKEGRKSEAISLFALYSKKSSGNPYLKICDLTNIFLRMPL